MLSRLIFIFVLCFTTVLFGQDGMEQGLDAPAVKPASDPPPVVPETVDPAFESPKATMATFIDAMERYTDCLLYTSPSPRDQRGSRMPSSA